MYNNLKSVFTLSLIAFCSFTFAQTIQVGEGSYTTQFPGVDAAGRNGFPSGTPFTTGNAAQKPAPTNDWWSAKIKNNHVSNLFNYPYTLKTKNQGLVTSYIPWGVIDDYEPVTVGVVGLNASAAMVSDFTDWTITMDWKNGNRKFSATAGIGMPFLYFEKDSADVAQVVVANGTVTVVNEMLVITDSRNGADFAIYAPVGSTWSKTGTTYTSTLNGKNYWSMAFIPLDATSVSAVANEYKKYAYVFPVNTTTSWNYDTATSVVTTDFNVETEIKEGADSVVLMGLLPHQWAHLGAGSPSPAGYSYETVRGELKTLAGNNFSVQNTFYGVLPTLPYVDNYSEGFSPVELNQKIESIKNDALATWTDSYNEGQVMNRLIQTARIADQIGNTEARDKMISTIKERLEDWLEVNANEVAFIFYYNKTWSALLGYPAGHGQDININDHHFHWGYFIHAAAFLEQYEPGWSNDWGDMINLLVRDASSTNRNDTMFPFLRNFSPYAGHCWANGFASFPQGNDQESTSESMQFNTSLIHWGEITGNKAIRDLGIYLYTTEQTAIEEYWLDINERNFKPTQAYSLVSRVWGNSYDNGTFWTSDIAASYGIEMYPIHGGSFYLGHDTNYVKKLWNEIESNTGVLTNEANVNLWHDVYWCYLALINPSKALDMYDSYPERELKFGISDAQTYHWLHASNALGLVDVSKTANHPLAMAFTQNGKTIYVAHNYGADSLYVSFSDGYVLSVGPHSMRTSIDVSVSGELAVSFNEAYANGSVDLTLNTSGETPSKIAFYDNGKWIGETTQAPYQITADSLALGKHYFHARIYKGDNFNVSNMELVLVGEQLPYLGYPIVIPGELDPAYYDIFEGGSAKGISYEDDNEKQGGFRNDETVDASNSQKQGHIISNIAAGEWLEYTVDVQQAGLYKVDIAYSSDEAAGGGPIQLELNNDTLVSGIKVTSTGDWTTFNTKTVNDVPLKRGMQILRIRFGGGGFNLGKVKFTYSAVLPYSQPEADAGENVLVVQPSSTAQINGSLSTNGGSGNLAYAWKQIYGPSKISIQNANAAIATIDNLVNGVYLFELEVENGVYKDQDRVYVISSANSNIPPKVSLYSPTDKSIHLEEDSILLQTITSDLIGTVERVHFYANNKFIGADSVEPYELKWTPTIGVYQLRAVAIDDDEDSSSSQLITVTVQPKPPCRGTSANGDFDFKFSPDKSNPTLTFIPNKSGMGSPTCILYYGTSSGSLPGYGVSPNTPFKLNAAEGSTVYAYYTYSHPQGGERNTADSKIIYKVGSCKAEPVSILDEKYKLAIRYYPNPVNSNLHLELPIGRNEIEVLSAQGQVVDNVVSLDVSFDYAMDKLSNGVYFLKITNGEKQQVIRVVKQ
jgi:endoglucanase Acf2